MRRFFVDPESFKSDQVILVGDEFHHLKNVCRLEVGERVELLDGQGKLAKATIDVLEKKRAVLKIEEIKSIPPPPPPRLDIILSMPRFQKIDFIVQKCVELNAARLIPVVSDRSFVKTISSADLMGKVERWQKISAEACKQSGRAWPMEFCPVSTLKTEVSQATPHGALFLFEGEGQIDIKQALGTFQKPPATLKIFIGAEGGFSQGEVAGFLQKQMKPITLGPLVLRVETACIAVLSVIQYHFDLMR